MKQPDHVKSLVATFRGAGYPAEVRRSWGGGGWFIAVSTKANGHLIGLTVVDDFSVVFEGAQSAEYAGQISDYSDRDRVSLFEECDREGLKALFEEA